MPFPSRLVASAALAGSVAVSLGSPSRERTLLSIVRDAALASTPAAGVEIAGRPVTTGEARRVVDRLAARVETARVRVVPVGLGRGADTTLGALGVHVDVEPMVRRANEIGNRGSFAVRLGERLAAARGAIDVPLALTFDVSRAISLLVALKESTDERAVPARYDFAEHAVVPEREGSELDVDEGLASLRRAAARAVSDGASSLTVEIPRERREPSATAERLGHFDPRDVVATFETTYPWLGKEAPRAHNIAEAAAHLDGTVLLPHEIVSFNDVVGPRTTDNGFARAFQIYKGEMIEGVGGGTCQVSSTLHAAALYAGLRIVERAPHSRPLGYVPLGLDSTVVYPEVDLKLENPWPFPIAVHAAADRGTIRVELLGERRPATVRLVRETLHVEPYTRRVEVHPELRAGRYLLKQKGIRGYDIRVIRRVTTTDGVSREERTTDRYPETPELYWVAPGIDPDALLPPLADAASQAAGTGKATGRD
jgi:vancomycin resistance protein YoaR